jgi:hypothetical protein
MPAKLTGIKLREISFVDKGASGDAEHRPRVAFWKRQDPQQSNHRSDSMKLTKAVIAKVFKAIDLKKEGMPEGAQAVLDSIKSTLSEEQWAIVEMMLAAGAPAPIAAAADKPADPVADPKKEEEALAMSKKKAEEEALAKKEADEKAAAIEKAKKASPEVAAALEAIEKRAASAEARAVELEKSQKSLLERVEKSEKETAEEIQKRRVVTFTKLAEGDLKYLPGKPEDIAKRLCDIEDALGPDDFAKYLQEQKSAAALIAKSGAFGPKGAAGHEVGSAYDAIVAKAREFQKTEVGAKLSEKQAIAKVVKSPEHRDLVKRYREEMHGAH